MYVPNKGCPCFVPRHENFKKVSCGIPVPFVKLCQLNKPERHRHKVDNLNSVNILTLTSMITSKMEKVGLIKAVMAN